MTATHQAAKPAELLVGNFNDDTGDFDSRAAHRLFAVAAHRQSVIAALVADARSGWDGIHLDFESLSASDREGLTRFTTELQAALPPSKTLSMAVMASTSQQGYRDDAYDLSALSGHLTHVVLMAYDQHGPTWTSAGPIGGLPWAQRATRAFVTLVPRSKAVLGVAGYGYTWPAKGVGAQLSDADARRIEKAGPATWDATQGEWHAPLAGGGTVWWSDARSLTERRALARRFGMTGVAVWSLGLSDRL